MKPGILIMLLLLASAPALAQQDDWQDWEDWDDEWSEEDADGLHWSGFLEGAFGSRWDEDPQVNRNQSLGDLRARAETEWIGERITIGFTGEAWYDDYLESFETELRELSLAFSPNDHIDVKLGRQVLTWGTGDLLFLNDLFPKDWVSFFAGRDDEYLKAPSNTVRATWYSDLVNVDIAWTPEFEPDEFLTGERFSFFSPMAGQRIAPSPPLNPIEPRRDFENGEWALRLFKTVEGSEYAFYAYHGFFSQPNAFTETFQPTFVPLSAIGASVRRPLGRGLFNAETAYYFSRDDRSGTDPNVPNDQFRLLLGYEQEAMANFTMAFQYYLEWTQDHGELIENSATPAFEPDEFRHVLTNRLSYRLLQDKLTLSLFTFYSPSDKDFYLRPIVSYRYSDQWSFTAGANIFGGSDAHTFFNQFADNSNVYVRVRYYF